MLSHLKKLIIIGALVFLGSYSHAFALGTYYADPAFNPGTGANGQINATAIQSDGKIIIAGGFTTYNGTTRTRIARVNTDGSLDTSFDPGTGVNDAINAVAIQSDGKIIIGGIFSVYNGTLRSSIARINTDGTLDTSFDPGTGADSFGTPGLNAIAIQSDGKIMIVGYFTTYNGTSRLHIARVNTDGSLDSSFDPGTGLASFINDVAYSVAIQSDGKILVGGCFISYNGATRPRIARINTDGTLDTSFDPGVGLQGGALPIVQTISLQSDGQIIIGGSFLSYNNTARAGIARINTDGTLDTSFDPGTGIGSSSVVYSSALQSDGKIIIAGNFTTYNGTSRIDLARINTDGTLDTSFDPGTGSNAIIYATAVQSNNKPIIAGTFTTFGATSINRIARVTVAPAQYTLTYTAGTGGSLTGSASQTVYSGTSGTSVTAVPDAGYVFVNWSDASTQNPRTDTNVAGNISVTANFAAGYTFTYSANPLLFTAGTGPSAAASAMAIQSDGKIIIGGSFTTYNGIARNRIARINTNGLLDTTFDPGTGADATISALAIQSDGKIVITGSFANYNGTARNKIARINTDGSLDTSFDPGTGPNGATTIGGIALQSDNKAVIIGGFSSFNGTSKSKLARLNTDGSVDTSFDPGTGPNLVATARLAVQSDGKIIIHSNFISYNGTSRMRFARINTDGSLDTSFVPGTSISTTIIYAMAIQSDGKILIGGTFTTYTGTSRNRIARVNTDGSLDTSFDPGTGASATVIALSLQSDGKILIGGTFTTYNGTSRAGIARINTDGSLDTSFDPGSGASSVSTSNLESDGNLIIGGSFTTYNSVTANRITRVELVPATTHGSITGSTPQTVATSASGSAVTAVPDSGYSFVNWSDASTSNPRTDTNASVDISVYANFAVGSTHTLTYTAGAHGSITGTSPQTVNDGDDGTAVTAVPDTGYDFVDWSDASTDNPRTDTNVTGDVTVTANFAIQTKSLSYSAGANGSLTGTASQTVNYGSDGSAVTAVPDTGYHFVDWSDASTDNPRTDTNVTGDVTVTANFAIDTHTLTYTAGANGTLTGSSPQTINYGADGTAITAVPNSGYSFSSWSDASTTNPRTDTNVTGDISVTASFTANPVTSSSSGGGSSAGGIHYTCKDSKATNYDVFGSSDPSLCKYTNSSSPSTTPLKLGGGTLCTPSQILTQNLHAPSRNGRYDKYTKGIVKEAKILQAHMNRLGFASGKEDGIIGPITDGAIKRMQIFLGTKPDGYIGPITRGLINNSCGKSILVMFFFFLWYTFCMQIFDSQFLIFIAKVSLAMILGLLLGLERVYAHKTAGMRTYALVSVATCFFTIISLYIGANLAHSGDGFNPAFITGSIITGIGFLGAGLIIFQNNHIQNLTTSAGLWVCAGIGIAIGFGMFREAIFATLLTFFVLGGLSFVERAIRLKYFPDPEFEKSRKHHE